MNFSNKKTAILISAVFLIIVDRFLKILVWRNQDLDVTLVPGLLDFRLALNPYIAFSLPLGGVWLAWVLAGAILALVWWAVRCLKSGRSGESIALSAVVTAWLIGWEAQSGDPDNFWFWHFGAGRAASEGQYYNDALAAQLLQAQRAVGGAARAELYRSAAESVMTDAARAFLVHSREIIALSPRVRGYEADTMGFDNLSAVRLAPAPSGATSALPLCFSQMSMIA